MSIQFAGSKSFDDRRRRRLAVFADDQGDDETNVAEGPPASGVASELVASSAAAPWVPVTEGRLWAYVALMGLLLFAAAFALAMPMAFRPELAQVTGHFLHGDRPVLAVLIQSVFCFLAAQLAILIRWYRAQCKLDFRGHYRVWTWATILFGIAGICSATHAHGLLAEIVGRTGLVSWRTNVVAWMLPAAIAALPLVILIDRDVRRGTSTLYTFRVAWVLAIVSACLELFAIDLQFLPWIARARVILPMFVAATLFVGLWLHARVVAYVCPDPPESEDTTAVAQLMAGWQWIATRLLKRRRVVQAVADEDSENQQSAKPKRTRRKTNEDESDEEAPKRKRKAPVKRVAKPRVRKVAEVGQEEEGTEPAEEEETTDSVDSSSADTTDDEEASSEWEQESDTDADQYPAAPIPQPNRSNRDSNPPPPKPHFSASEPNRGYTSYDSGSSESENGDEDSEDALLGQESGLTAEEMKGLSKRQKRELRKQARDKQRNQRR